MKRTILFTLQAGVIAGCLTAALGISGCTSGRSERVGQTDAGLTLTSTTREVYAGEIITFTAQTRNLVGRDAEVRWSTTGGELTTEESGRIARVRFDRPGQYVISSQLFVDGEMELTEAVTVEVKPLR